MSSIEPDPDPYRSLQWVAQHLGVTDRAVRGWIASGQLRAVRLGHGPGRKAIRVRESWVDDLLADVPAAGRDAS